MQNNDRVAIIKKVTKNKDSAELAKFSLQQKKKRRDNENDT